MKKLMVLVILIVFSTALFSQDQNTGYKGTVNIGYGLGTGENGRDRFKIDIVNGYQLNQYFSIGGGIAYRYYLENQGSIFPLYLNFEAVLPKDEVSPYFTTSLGYSFDPTLYFDLGEYAETSDLFRKVGGFFELIIGAKYKINDKTNLKMGFGIEIQKFNYNNTVTWEHGGAALRGFGNMSFYNDLIDKHTEIVSINVGIDF